jgi:ATP-binding cassette subfamily B protein
MKKSGSMQWTTIRTVWNYIRRRRLLILATLLLSAVSVILTLYVPVLVGNAIDLIAGSGLVDFAGVGGILVRIGVVVAATAVCQWVMEVINNRITYQVVRDIRNDAFDRLQILSLDYVDRRSHGDILSRVIADVDQFADGLLLGFTQLFTGVLSIVLTLIFMLLLHPGITLLVVVLTPISLMVAAFIARRTYDMFRKQSEIRAEQTAFIDEMIGGQKTVQAFSQEEASQSRFDEINERLAGASVRATFFSSITNPATRFVNSLVYAAVALTGALTALSGGITVGGIAAFLSYANQYTKPFNEISGVVTELQNALACAARIFDFIGTEPQIPDSAYARKLEDARGRVEMLHLSFSYTPEQRLIEDFNLSVVPGQRVAIVGPTGCGKTTLINLLMRFYDVRQGHILVEGCDVRDITRHSLRRSFGMVLQDTWLRDGTIRDNIAMGKRDATQEEIEAAAKASHAHDFIMQLSHGYDTVIKGDGGGLSQGQRQMLCITRVMLCLPPMLILDEATSSIDTRTEVLIQSAFAQLMQGKTSFIVAHRLSTIREADMILVMRDGNVVEQGDHETLLRQNGLYRQLYDSQFSG